MAEKENSRPFFGSLGELIRRWKAGTFGEILDDWKWIFTYSRRYKGAILVYILFGIASSSLSIVSSIAGKYLIDIITGYQIERLPVLILITLVSAGVSLLFTNLTNRISTKLSIDINNEIQADIFDRIVDTDWLSLNRFSSGDLLNRFNSDVNTVASNAVTWLPTVLISIYNFCATFAVIWHYNKIMALIVFISVPAAAVMSRFLITKQRGYARKTRKMSSQLMNFEAETFYNRDTIKSFGIAGQYGKKMRGWQEKFRDIALAYNLFTIKTNVFLSILGLVVQYTAFGYCLFLLWTRQITFGTMTLFLEQRSKLSSAFNSVISIIPNFLNSSVSAHRIREIVQLPRERHLPESRKVQQLAGKGLEVRMEHVDFTYENEQRVITDSGFCAKPGEIVALVGPSGDGKTTLIRLILGLVQPDAGKVYLKTEDGTCVESNADTRRLFAYVPQGNTILSGTVAENMRMVKENASDEELVQALKTACAWDFVQELPETINSKIGERGKGLSEGQAQRIAIARAVLLGAPVMLLDEATSALDVTTERQVLRNIIQERPDRTCIVTTHRPTVLGMCRRVYRVVDTHVTEMTEEEASHMAMDF